MHLKSLLALVVVLLSTQVTLRGQAPATAHTADSLRRIWQTPPGAGMADSTRLRAVAELQWLYLDIAPDSLLHLSTAICKDARNRGDRRWLAQGLYGFGLYQRMNGSADSVRYFCRQALGCLIQDQAPELYSNLLYMIGTEWSKSAIPDSAVYYLSLALETRKAWRLPPEQVYHNLAVIYQNQGEFGKAFEYFKAARTSPNPRIQISAATNIGNMLLDWGLREEGRENMRIAVRIADSLGGIPNRVIAYAGMISAAPTLREVDHWLNRGNTLCESGEYQDVQIFLLYSAATRFMDSLNHAKARVIFTKCAALSAQRKIAQLSALCKISLARIDCAEKHPQDALALCREVKPYFLQENVSLNLETLFEVLYRSFDLLGNRDSAFHYLKLKDQYASRNAEQNVKVAALLEYVKYKTKLEQEALQKAKETAEALTLETRARQKLVFWLSGALIALISSIALFLYSIYRQKKRSEQVLTEANSKLAAERENLQRANAKLHRFSGIVSHDILSNLDLMLSAGHILAGVQANKASLLQYRDMMQQTGRQLKDYCINLLQEAKLAPEETQTVRVDPAPVIHRVLARLEPALQAANVQVESGPLSPAPLPEPVIEQLFQNLISNALHHAATKPMPMLRIAEETAWPNGTHWIVEDNGPGVPPEQREAIFSPQFQGSSSGRHIGLSLLRTTLHEHGADIRVEDRSGGGARFVIVL